MKDPRVIALITKLTGLLLQIEVVTNDFTVCLCPYQVCFVCVYYSAPSCVCICNYFQALSESANSLQVNTLSQSVEEISHCIQPVNRRYNCIYVLLLTTNYESVSLAQSFP